LGERRTDVQEDFLGMMLEFIFKGREEGVSHRRMKVGLEAERTDREIKTR
jgi:hypothetical protein